MMSIGIHENDLKLLKCLANPPMPVKNVMLATYAILIDEIPLWEKTKKMFMDHKSLKVMIDNYDMNDTSPSKIKILDEYIGRISYNVDIVESASAACVELMKWIMKVYSKDAQKQQ